MLELKAIGTAILVGIGVLILELKYFNYLVDGMSPSEIADKQTDDLLKQLNRK